MNRRTVLRSAACAGLFAIMAWQGLPRVVAAHAADRFTAAADQPPAGVPSPHPGKRGALRRITEDAAAAVQAPSAEEQTDAYPPRLRSIGKRRYPREEPDVGFGGPSRTPDAGGEAAR